MQVIGQLGLSGAADPQRGSPISSHQAGTRRPRFNPRKGGSPHLDSLRLGSARSVARPTWARQSNHLSKEARNAEHQLVVITGNLTRDPELRTTEGGTKVCNLRVAVNGRRKNGNDEWVDKPNYFNVTVWGAQGESCAEYLAKGRPVAVEGRLDCRSAARTTVTASTSDRRRNGPVPRRRSRRTRRRTAKSPSRPRHGGEAGDGRHPVLAGSSRGRPSARVGAFFVAFRRRGVTLPAQRLDAGGKVHTPRAARKRPRGRHRRQSSHARAGVFRVARSRAALSQARREHLLAQRVVLTQVLVLHPDRRRFPGSCVRSSPASRSSPETDAIENAIRDLVGAGLLNCRARARPADASVCSFQASRLDLAKTQTKLKGKSMHS